MLFNENKFDVVQQMISDIPFLLNSLRSSDRTLLIEAASVSDVRFFKFLVQFDQDFAVVDEYGRNVAHWIVRNKVNCVELLNMLKHETPTLFRYLINHLDKDGDSPLHVAAWFNKYELIEYLFEHGANVNARNKNRELPDNQRDCDQKTKSLIREYRDIW